MFAKLFFSFTVITCNEHTFFTRNIFVKLGVSFIIQGKILSDIFFFFVLWRPLKCRRPTVRYGIRCVGTATRSEACCRAVVPDQTFDMQRRLIQRYGTAKRLGSGCPFQCIGGHIGGRILPCVSYYCRTPGIQSGATAQNASHAVRQRLYRTANPTVSFTSR